MAEYFFDARIPFLGFSLLEGILDASNHLFQYIHALKNDVDDMAVDIQFPIPCHIQQAFNRMGQPVYLWKVKEAGDPLDGMERPEYRIDGFWIGGVFFEI